MHELLDESLRQLKKNRVRRLRFIAVVLVLSLIVSLDVFWVLRQPGLTLAGDADCKITEHTHSHACYQSNEIRASDAATCGFAEHVHSVECYSDDTADVENPLSWQETFANYPYTGSLRQDLVGIAQTQVGYTESKLNFEVGNDGIRRGYTRYGDWYGVPYNDWSALFVSFCLNYAGATNDTAPINIGASSMAKLWRSLGKYAPAKAYTPVSGDLVFFCDNTVGIVAKVYTSSFYVIRGDVENTVRGDMMPLNEPSIIGWGITEGTITPQNPHSNNSELLDITNGPAVFIFEGEQTSQAKPQLMRFSLRNARAATDLLPYLEANGGTYFFTLLDTNNQELPKDANGNYVVQTGANYKLTISFTSPEGFHPGVYQYNTPQGLIVDGGEGTFILKDGTTVGDWTVTDEGLITMNFNDHMNSRSDITISATLGVSFPDSDSPIDFDGKITVTIEKPPQDVPGTQVNKWGSQGSDANGKDASKLHWTVYIVGREGSNLPGSTITDNVIKGEYLGTHIYTQSDMANGLTIGVSEYDPVTWQAIDWHSWTVYPGDPNLTWTETGWSYVLPEHAQCDWCGNITPGNLGWEYYIEYSSTPTDFNVSGGIGYMNHVAVDKAAVDGWAEFVHGEIHADIEKNGDFISDAQGGSFVWEFQALIPGIKQGQKAEYFWYFMDYMDIHDSSGGAIGYVTNDADHARVTASHNGATIPVPRVQDATANDPFAWDPYWSMDHGDGIYYGHQMNILCRCHCTEATCPFWSNGRCGSEYWFEGDDGYWYTNGYCQCWTEPENTMFTFTYKTDDLSTIEAYGGFDHQLRNRIELYNKIIMPNGTISGAMIANSQDSVPIPDLFTKKLTHDFDGYTANYNITINEAKIVLTDGSPLTIHDTMTQTLAYIQGSLVITAEDANGNVTTLHQGVDYTLHYDGTGNETNENGEPVHVLDIVVLHPQPVKYVLSYDATLIIPPGTTQAIKYDNAAKITLWGQDITDTTVEKVFADINISAKSYKVHLYKMDSKTGAPLEGALFGLYNEHGGQITTSLSSVDGELVFQTNVTEGIILRDHVLYYVQELKAPDRYRLDTDPHWFCFCDTSDEHCAACNELLADVNGLRIPHDTPTKMKISNELMGYILPSTGSIGQTPLILCGLGLMLISLVCGCALRRKRERRAEK
ncbi:MAG: hypothetical protein IKU25_05425 [Clostridia bacterium]|nr:hypothetical protein [Clostridia bacterium]